ncbi:hypothetical protein B0H17DRAFT_1135128 [Mycena rosella]|uniref:Uncharacterized protein n=1 Tax=Mycena rosella TaxID=1033263 RepID=A0AAD7DGY0_MYCRO|nr:hypothetical protein B0H17DRAFT_1135128 [Mycena rosella]
MVPSSMVVSSAPALVFDNVFAITDDDTGPAEGTVVMSELLLGENLCESVCELLGRPEFSHYAANLRRLALRAYYRYSGGFISAAVPFIWAPMPTFPSFSAPTPLRTIDVVASIYEESWLVQTLATLLASIPAIIEGMSITYFIVNVFSRTRPHHDYFPPPYFKPKTMASLTRILDSHRNPPPIT